MVSMVLEKTMVFVNFFCKEKEKKKTKNKKQSKVLKMESLKSAPLEDLYFFWLEIKEKLEKDSFS